MKDIFNNLDKAANIAANESPNERTGNEIKGGIPSAEIAAKNEKANARENGLNGKAPSVDISVKNDGFNQTFGNEINGEILSAALGVIKNNNRKTAVKEFSGNCFRALDAAVDGGEIYRIIVIKCGAPNENSDSCILSESGVMKIA
jgi:hypothetical protein